MFGFYETSQSYAFDENYAREEDVCNRRRKRFAFSTAIRPRPVIVGFTGKFVRNVGQKKPLPTTNTGRHTGIVSFLSNTRLTYLSIGREYFRFPYRLSSGTICTKRDDAHPHIGNGPVVEPIAFTAPRVAPRVPAGYVILLYGPDGSVYTEFRTFLSSGSTIIRQSYLLSVVFSRFSKNRRCLGGQPICAKFRRAISGAERFKRRNVKVRNAARRTHRLDIGVQYRVNWVSSDRAQLRTRSHAEGGGREKFSVLDVRTRGNFPEIRFVRVPLENVAFCFI